MYIYSVDSKRIEHVFAEQFCQDFVPNPQQTAYATLMAEVRLRETFARRSSMHGDAEGAGREAAIKEEVKRLRALLEGDPIST